MKNSICLLAWISLLPAVSLAQLINDGATVVISPGTFLVIDNLAFNNNGVFKQTAGIVSFTGTAGTSVGGNKPSEFYIMNLNKPGAVLKLETGITVTNQLQFNDGILNLNNNTILLDPSAVITGESETSYITGASGGYVQITKPLNAPSADDPGNLGAIISSFQNLGSVTVRRGHQSQVNNVGGGNSTFRYYDIIPDNNTALNATLRFSYLDAELNGLNESSLNVWRSYNNVTWANLLSTSRDVSTNYVELAGINNFARFTLSTPGNALPLIWNSFNTQCQSGQVRISWKTEQEQNTSSFTLRRSIDGRTWTTIATLPAAGNSSSPINYSYSDQQSPAGKIYYQILQQDFDGRITVSPVLANSCGADENLMVYPNPFTTSCWVSIQSAVRSSITIRLYDSKGSLVHQQRESIQKGNNQLPLHLNQLAPGIYSLIVSWTNGETKLTKIEKH